LTLDEAAVLTRSWPSKPTSAGGRVPARVGVFVDPPLRFVQEACARLELDAVQWHGDAPVEPLMRSGLPWVWVVRGTPSLADLRVGSPAPRWILLDAAVRGYGGAGARTDWDWAAKAVRHLAPHDVWLAGGIDPDNARSAIAQVGPAGLDVASGAESPGDSPGFKDPGKIAALAAICNNPGES